MRGDCCKGECASLAFSVMADLSQTELCKLRDSSLTLLMQKGQVMFAQGRSAEGFFCIRRGVVKVELEAENGESITLYLLTHKGMLGHHCMVSSKNIYTATCLTETEVCFIPRTIINNLKNTNPGIDNRIKALIAEEYEKLCNIILSLRTKSVQQRTAEALIKLQNLFGKDANGAIDFEMTKREMAKFIGSSIESVFRMLAEFHQKDYIDFVGTDKRRIRVKKEVKLRSLGKIHV